MTHQPYKENLMKWTNGQMGLNRKIQKRGFSLKYNYDTGLVSNCDGQDSW